MSDRKIFKIKEWMQNSQVQFEVVRCSSRNRVLSVKRLSDEMIFGLGSYPLNGVDELFIIEFYDDLIHVMCEITHLKPAPDGTLLKLSSMRKVQINQILVNEFGVDLMMS